MQEIIKGPFMHWEPPNPFFVPEFADGHPTGQSQGAIKLFSFSLAWSPCPPLERSKTPSHQISAAVARFFGAKSSRWTCLIDRGPREQEFPFLVDRTVLELTSSFTVLHGLLIQPNFLYLRRILSRMCWVDLGS